MKEQWCFISDFVFKRINTFIQFHFTFWHWLEKLTSIEHLYHSERNKINDNVTSRQAWIDAKLVSSIADTTNFVCDILEIVCMKISIVTKMNSTPDCRPVSGKTKGHLRSCQFNIKTYLALFPWLVFVRHLLFSRPIVYLLIWFGAVPKQLARF